MVFQRGIFSWYQKKIQNELFLWFSYSTWSGSQETNRPAITLVPSPITWRWINCHGRRVQIDIVNYAGNRKPICQAKRTLLAMRNGKINSVATTMVLHFVQTIGSDRGLIDMCQSRFYSKWRFDTNLTIIRYIYPPSFILRVGRWRISSFTETSFTRLLNWQKWCLNCQVRYYFVDHVTKSDLGSRHAKPFTYEANGRPFLVPTSSPLKPLIS